MALLPARAGRATLVPSCRMTLVETLAPSCALFLDFDGTMVDIAPQPQAVQVPEPLIAAILASRRQGEP